MIDRRLSRFDHSRERGERNHTCGWNRDVDRCHRWNSRKFRRRRFNNFEHEVELVPSIGKLGHADALTNGHLSGRCCTGSTLCQLTFPINNRLNNPLSTSLSFLPHLLAFLPRDEQSTRLRTCCSHFPFSILRRG